jgi:holo-[acyl-carrier protein] synthase
MFPSGLAIGVDLVDVSRIHSLILRFGGVFLRRLFTDIEISNCEKLAHSAAAFAARFAAKEAFAKAIGTGIGSTIGWKDAWIEKKQSGEPTIMLSARATEKMRSCGYASAKVSISHTKTLAQAVVVLIR